MIDGTEQKLLYQLMGSPQWKAFEHLIQEVCAKIQDDAIGTTTEWETLKDTLLREGQLKGIRRLMQEAYLQVQQGQNK